MIKNVITIWDNKRVSQGHSQDFTLRELQKLRAEGAEGGGDWGKSVFLPNQLGALEECRELPQRGPGRSLGR